MNTKKATKQIRLQYWAGVIKECQESGQKTKDWIVQHNITHDAWANVSLDEFIFFLDNYIRWYSTSRIKMSLGAMSPIEYRRSLGLIA